MAIDIQRLKQEMREQREREAERLEREARLIDIAGEPDGLGGYYVGRNAKAIEMRERAARLRAAR